MEVTGRRCTAKLKITGADASRMQQKPVECSRSQGNSSSRCRKQPLENKVKPKETDELEVELDAQGSRRTE